MKKHTEVSNKCPPYLMFLWRTDAGSCTLTCLASWVGNRSSSTSFTAALPLNKSMVIPGGRRPWCCCHFRDFRDRDRPSTTVMWTIPLVYNVECITALTSCCKGSLTHLSKQSHQTWRWYHTDLTSKRLSYSCSTLLLTAAIRIGLNIDISAQNSTTMEIKLFVKTQVDIHKPMLPINCLPIESVVPQFHNEPQISLYFS